MLSRRYWYPIELTLGFDLQNFAPGGFRASDSLCVYKNGVLRYSEHYLRR
jgi:hypothetical protein